MTAVHGDGEIELSSIQVMFGALINTFGENATIATLPRRPCIAGLFGDLVEAASRKSAQRHEPEQRTDAGNGQLARRISTRKMSNLMGQHGA